MSEWTVIGGSHQEDEVSDLGEKALAFGLGACSMLLLASVIKIIIVVCKRVKKSRQGTVSDKSQSQQERRPARPETRGQSLTEMANLERREYHSASF
jgi:hypothetical protein